MSQKNEQSKAQDPAKRAPRALKYAWAGLMTLLLVASVTLEKGSVFMPLINTAIDLMQQQSTSTPGR